MKAILTDRKEKWTTSFRREQSGLHKSYTLINCKTKQILAELRIYYPNQTAYACLWIRNMNVRDDFSTSTQGNARSVGNYNRESEVTCYAFYNSGIDLSENIINQGREGTKDALLAIGRDLCGASEHDMIIVEAHP